MKQHLKGDKPASWLPLMLLLSLWLFATFEPKEAHGYSLSYGFQAASTMAEEEKPETSTHQLVLTDGYCLFIHQGPFNRVCFEAGPGFRFDPFAFEFHAQSTLHAIWLRPLMFGFIINAGLYGRFHPHFETGLKFALGAHLYFVTPAVEFQISLDEYGRTDARVFLQIGLYIPTGSINFAVGNVGL